MEASVYKVRGG